MTGNPSDNDQTRALVLAAEREAQMVSAFARLLITCAAITLFLIAGGLSLPVAPVVLTYLGSYAVVSIISAIFSMERFFDPKMSLFFTAIDGCSLALLIGFALTVSGSPMSLHSAVPGFVFFFSILILATMRYTVLPVIIAFVSFAGTWFVFSSVYGIDTTPQENPGFFFGSVQNAARWGFVGIATLLALLAVSRRRRTLETAITAANRSANLSRYLPDRIADVVAEQGIDALKSGRQQHAVVLFADIRGFTGISEQLPPKELGQMLSAFRAIVTKEVAAHSGFVEKFIGDAVMAVFGVPSDNGQAEKDGLACCLRILKKIEDWNHERQRLSQPPVKITIGAHCGEVFAGAIGTPDRMEFTVLGDTVNVAARLQETAKSTQSGLVVSGELLRRASGEEQAPPAWSALDQTDIRGRVAQITSFAYDPG